MQAVRKWTVVAVLAMAATNAFCQEQTWKINIKNADIQEFVAQVAEITGKTFVVDPRLKGDVTVISSESMNADAIYALFLSVLRAHNFTAVPSGDVIRIQQTATGKQTPGVSGDLAKIAPEELVTRVIAAQNVDSAELVKMLRPLTSGCPVVGLSNPVVAHMVSTVTIKPTAMSFHLAIGGAV
jgi:general secretion pathway protein D